MINYELLGKVLAIKYARKLQGIVDFPKIGRSIGSSYFPRLQRGDIKTRSDASATHFNVPTAPDLGASREIL